MSKDSNAALIRKTYFEDATGRLRKLAARLTDDPDATVEDAGALFDSLLPEMGYLDRPDHPMASSVFTCSANLALYLALAPRGVDVHAFGRAMLEGLAAAPMPAEEPADDAAMEQLFDAFAVSAEESQNEARPGEFVYEMFRDGAERTWGMNVKSCAICAQYARHDAMDLVPYMCATDDVVSDKGNQGLRRTGTIALGAHQCDFRFQPGGEPLRVAAQYPDRIRVAAVD